MTQETVVTVLVAILSLAATAFGFILARLFSKIDKLEDDAREFQSAITDLTRWQKDQNGAIHRVEGEVKQLRVDTNSGVQKILSAIERST